PVPAIPFTGAATSCRWYSSNPNVNADLHAPFHGEGLSFPGFTTANITDEIIRSVVTVTPVYSYRSGVNAFVCEGEPVEFFIIAGPVPFIEPIENIRIGEYGTTGEFVPLRLPSGSGYHLEWTVSDSRIGLESHIYTPGDTERKTIPGLKATIFPNELNEPSVATVTVTPLLTAGNTTFRGDSVQFTITVVPQTRLRPGFGEEVETEQNCCIGDPVELKVEATGYALKYQWYRNHLPIPGADKAVFTIDRAAVEHDGDYYATVTGENGSLKSKTWKVTVKPNVVSQRWDDVLVLNTNPADNGGYGFSGYQWYEITPEGTVKLPGETLSYLYVAGGPVSSRQYYVEAITGNGQNFQSCPVSLQPLQPQAEIRVYPNPVRAGGYVTVEIHAAGNDATIMLLDITSKIVSQTKAAGDITHIKIPGSGIYILEVILTDTVKSFKIIVL
ncbi:MAG: T9SS type A sorting domain-containing protein, partial [Tannerella sp.]|nr:T9SS type A sorting domain-containing protein [Tannerella sp.]